MQGKLFQKCTHHLYCSVLSLGGNVNTRRMSKLDRGSVFDINNQWNILVIGNFYVNYQNDQNSMLLTSSDTKRTLRHLVYKFRPERTGFNMYAEYTQLQLDIYIYSEPVWNWNYVYSPFKGCLCPSRDQGEIQIEI